MIKIVHINGQEYQFELTDVEEALLNEFILITKNIQELSFIQNFSTSYTLSTKPNEPLGTNIQSPSDEKLSILLHKIRPIILQDERTFFKKISSLIGKKIENKQFRQHLKDLNKSFSIDREKQLIHIKIDDIEITNEEILFQWLNAYEYHRDIKKIEHLKPLIESLGIDLFRSTMIDKLISKYNAIQQLSYLSERFVGSPGQRIFIK